CLRMATICDSVNRFAFISLLFTVKIKIFALFFTGSLSGVQDSSNSLRKNSQQLLGDGSSGFKYDFVALIVHTL
ncbi:hypothetical protein, partial [Rudanella paleaurantiibacter]|uniref:hypothetical protein n=1 Tax=Rudanella paleaurantiibacter TaxID=2614655 RepID=UPI001C88E180